MTVKDALEGIKIGKQHIVVGYRESRKSYFNSIGGDYDAEYIIKRFGHMEIVHSWFNENVFFIEVKKEVYK